MIDFISWYSIDIKYKYKWEIFFKNANLFETGFSANHLSINKIMKETFERVSGSKLFTENIRIFLIKPLLATSRK